MKSERAICLRFTPQGNPRKRLDMGVVLVPEQNWVGQAGWLVWWQFGSKKKYIEIHNSGFEKLGAAELLISEESVDMD